jgi:hypothetical protein
LLDALNWYDGPMLQLAKKCLASDGTGGGRYKSHPDCSGSNVWRRNNIGLNDIYVLAHVLHDHKDIKHGWFANERWTCERPAEGNTPWFGQCQPCKNAAPGELVTPFWVDEVSVLVSNPSSL